MAGQAKTTSSSLGRIARKTLKERMVDGIYAAIADGELRAGEPVTELGSDPIGSARDGTGHGRGRGGSDRMRSGARAHDAGGGGRRADSAGSSAGPSLRRTAEEHR